jgi:hypothetical protein
MSAALVNPARRPRHAITGEPLDWWLLEQHQRFPAFAAVAGPLSPYQAWYPLSARVAGARQLHGVDR